MINLVDDRVISFFTDEKLFDEEFMEFMQGKVVVAPYGTDESFFCCFPIVHDDILEDIRVCVPEVHSKRDLLINVHEFAHALDLYNEIGAVYEDKREEREGLAKEMERVYLVKKG